MFLGVKPKRVLDWELISSDGVHFIVRRDTSWSIRCNEYSRLVWELCDGSRSLKEIMRLLAEGFPGAEGVENEVEKAVDQFLQLEAIEYID